MEEEITKQILFVLDDDNEIMRAAAQPDSDLDADNKQLNLELIKKHEAIISRIENNEPLTQKDMRLVKDANELHLNDVDNLAGHHQQAVKLNEWLEQRIELSKENAMRILEEHLDKDSCCPAKVY